MSFSPRALAEQIILASLLALAAIGGIWFVGAVDVRPVIGPALPWPGGVAVEPIDICPPPPDPCAHADLPPAGRALCRSEASIVRALRPENTGFSTGRRGKGAP